MKPLIKLNTNMPGIISLFETFPESAKPLKELAETLLRAPSPLSAFEREMIATYTSALNECEFCKNSHGAIAYANDENRLDWIHSLLNKEIPTGLSEKIHSLLVVAKSVQENNKKQTSQSIESAKSAGAHDREIHDTVLIAAAFCMFNRYVDGLGTIPLDSFDDYKPMGVQILKQGYAQ